MGEHFPLPTLLSQVLVAFTIEFDNESEHRMPHRTTRSSATAGSKHAPWLVSLAMWMNCMRFVGEGGIAVAELERRARTKTNLAGMQRWGYITVAPDPADTRPKPPASTWLIHATPAGRKAQEVWRPMFEIIERRWDERFGRDAMEKLRESVRAIEKELDPGLPDCLPILGYGLFSHDPKLRQQPVAIRGRSVELPLCALLSRVLLAFATEFESESKLSLAIYANVLRVLNENEVRVRDLPRLSGVSKEAIHMAMGILRKANLAVIEADTSRGRSKVALITPRGLKVREACRKRLMALEERWKERFGRAAIQALRNSLEPLVGEATVHDSPLFLGLKPYPDGWRASVRPSESLPHYPMVLHRGGFPDGS